MFLPELSLQEQTVNFGGNQSFGRITNPNKNNRINGGSLAAFYKGSYFVRNRSAQFGDNRFLGKQSDKASNQKYRQLCYGLLLWFGST